jgi:hypothetical protein
MDVSEAGAQTIGVQLQPQMAFDQSNPTQRDSVKRTQYCQFSVVGDLFEDLANGAGSLLPLR